MAAEYTEPNEPTNSLTPSFDEKYYDPSHYNFKNTLNLA
jgi:hypothetical protein